MDERTKELIAIGASTAVNCRPCFGYHLGECDRLGLDRNEVRAAVDVGLMVSRGAASKTRGYVGERLGDGKETAETGDKNAGDCGCAA